MEYSPRRIVLVLMCVLLQTTEQVDLECQNDWTNVELSCYRLFPLHVAWDTANNVCLRYGGHLLRIKDLHKNETAIETLSTEAGVTQLWLAYSSATQHQQHNQPSVTEDYHFHREPYNKQIGGHVNSSVHAPDACVLAQFTSPGQVVWAFAPCFRLTAFVCVRSAAPAGTFHCSNGVFVASDYVCDGEDDCGDGSDEMNCKHACSHHMRNTSGLVQSPDWTQAKHATDRRCLWLLEVPVGHNVRLEFIDVSLEPEESEIIVLDGGLTESTSREVARWSRDGDVSSIVSVNNLMIVVFNVGTSSVVTGFTANFVAVKADGFAPHQDLTGHGTQQTVLSPFYPSALSGHDYVWIVTALQSHGVLTLEIHDVDLNDDDIVEIRDGSSLYDPMMHLLTSRQEAEHVTYVQGTRHQMFIAMRTRALHPGRGFQFSYWQGCSIQVAGTSGKIVSPGYLIKGANYPANQTCVYEVTVPGLETVTLIFNHVDIHQSDELKIYENGWLGHTMSGMEPPPPIDLSGGAFSLTFNSDLHLTRRGFAAKYSVGCPNLHANSHTTVMPQTLVYHYGITVTLRCNHGYAFASPEPRSHNETPSDLFVECLYGGVWNVSKTPECKALCMPGSYYETVTEACDECPLRQYQSNVNATSCIRCPKGTVTEFKGANSSTECKKSCTAGQRYSRQSESCEVCPLGYYQSRQGQFSCQPCPPFKTTESTGATSVSLCTVEELDNQTEAELHSQGMILVSLHRHHHHHHNRQQSYPLAAKSSALSTLLFPPRQSPSRSSESDGSSAVAKPFAESSTAAESDKNEKSQELFFKPDKTDTNRVKRQTDTIRKEEQTNGETNDREKRQTNNELDDEFLDYSGCSGDADDFDPCNATNGVPCNATQDCEVLWDNAPRCVCKLGYHMTIHGECIELPENHKLYLTSPLDLDYDPDLSLQNSMAFLTFQAECQEAFDVFFKGIEACIKVQVLFFRSEGDKSDQTVVVSSLLFMMEVTEELRTKVAESVLLMESMDNITIGDISVNLAGFSGLFDSLAGTSGSVDDVDWCAVASLHECRSDKQCEDEGLRYTCQCPGSTSDVGGGCLNVGAVVGGVIGGLVAIAVVIVVVIVVCIHIRRRRAAEGNYTKTEEETTRESVNMYTALNPEQAEASHAYQNEDVELTESNPYDMTEPATDHYYKPFNFGKQTTTVSEPEQRISSPAYSNMATVVRDASPSTEDVSDRPGLSERPESTHYYNVDKELMHDQRLKDGPFYSNIN